MSIALNTSAGSLDLGDARVHYAVYGGAGDSGDRPALVFAHGLGGNHLSWWQQIPAFADRFRCIVFSHRGFAPSTDAAGTPDPARFAGDLAALLDHLAIERVAIVAQSMGGWTAMGFALAHPPRVSALVLSATTGVAGIASLPDADQEAIARWEHASAAARARLATLGIHPAAGERLAREQPAMHVLYQGVSALANGLDREALRARLMALRTRPARDLAALAMPVLCVSGSEDIVICPEAVRALAAVLPDGRLEMLEDTGHSPYFERAERFNAVVDAFLDREVTR